MVDDCVDNRKGCPYAFFYSVQASIMPKMARITPICNNKLDYASQGAGIAGSD